ncbi:MAG: 50S ribosomal protein L23 [Candidatus Diapherotrites archaeon]|nr:50S ribosomal protein L23 [Candidatus Diapherotrites archaeon]
MSKLSPSEVIYFPLITEKAVNMIEAENKICFIVNKKAQKTDVKNAVETLYSVKVDSVKTVNDMKGRKKAIVRINKKFKADELATKLGVL